MSTSDPTAVPGQSEIPAIPQELLTADAITQLANEVFAQFSGVDGNAPVDPVGTTNPLDVDAVTVDPAIAVGVEESPVPMPDFANISYDTFHVEQFDSGEEQVDTSLVSELLDPSDSEVIVANLVDHPTTVEQVVDYAFGDHPFLESKLDLVIEGLGEQGGSFDRIDSAAATLDVAPAGYNPFADGLTFNASSLQEPVAEYGVAGTSGDDEKHEGYSPSLAPVVSESATADVSPATSLDAARLREDFPILREKINGRRLVWLDNGATTQKPQSVIDRLSYFYTHENSNVHRTAHTLAARATDAYEGAREKIRRFINASSTDEIIYVRGATEGINLLANTFGEQNVCEGDEILISHLEHHANIVPWQMLCARKGAKLKVAPVDDSGQIILSEFERLISPRTKLISFTQVSNALGTITPAKEMIAIAHRHGVPVVLDGAQGVLHMREDVQDLDADFFVFSGHKMFAPTGIGVVYGKKKYLDSMPPWQGGGNMIDCVTFDHTTYQDPPWRFEAGTGSIADAVGLGAAIDYVSAIGMENIAAHEHELLQYGTKGLLTVPGLRIIGTAENKAAVMSFVLEGHEPEAVGAYLDREGIAVRAGHHCAQPILSRFGVTATVRPSLALYNTTEDLDLLVEALLRLQAGVSQ